MSGYLDQVRRQVREWDEARPRSRQKEPGWSDMSSCRAMLGYQLAEEWPTDIPDNWRAIAGTWLHENMTAVRRQATQFRAPGDPEVRFGVKVTYRGVPGTCDEVTLGGDWCVTDYKTPRLASAALWETNPDVLAEAMIQVHGYAAGLVSSDWWKARADAEGFTGIPKVRLLVMPVDGRFSDWEVYEEDFDIDIPDAAIDRLGYVQRSVAAGELLPRDKPWYFCEVACEFFGLCRGEKAPKELELITDAETEAAVDAYGLASELISANEEIRKRLRPLIEGVRGRTELGFKAYSSRPRAGKMAIDERAVEQEYASRGKPTPYLVTPPSKPAFTVVRDKTKPE